VIDMAAPNRTTIDDLRGATRLACDATIGITDLVEKMHHTILLRHPPFGASRAGATHGLTGLVYRCIRGATRVIGQGLDTGLAPVGAMLPEAESGVARDAWVSAINGIYGDHLERTGNPLAIEMSLRHGGRRIDPGRPADVLRDATDRLLVIVHGLCLNDLHWSRDGESRVEVVARQRGYTPIYLRYNSGRSIARNGRALAELLETLLGQWPHPVREIAIVGHSMGGLLARSASHHGSLAGHTWRRVLGRMVFLGTPHHGAPLERSGHRLDYVMELSPYVAPFTRLGKARSAGITDLRYGSITQDEQEFVPLPGDVDCYALAATLGKRRSLVAERLVGDGLVPLDSALGRHKDAARTLAIARERQWVGYEMGHLELLGRPEVYARLGDWLR
jgi:pimeloyl-ACP methyl ester carboxylesterase